MESITLPLPDDFHIHLRQDAALPGYARDAASQFGRVLVMPNTLPPLTSPQGLREYKSQIEQAAPGLVALMTFKLNATYSESDLVALQQAGAVAGKYYPAGVTTNSADGIADFESIFPVVEWMEKLNLVLCVHGEEPSAFCLDREEAFIHKVETLARMFPKLRIVFEHLSTKAAVEAVQRLPDQVAGTITVQHLLLTLDDLLGDGLQPHHFCKPLLKRPEDREALRSVAFSGNRKFFLGTDSAPHVKGKKECPCGAAGVYSAPVAIPLLVQEFESFGALDRLADYVGSYGADFYQLPRTTRTMRLVRESWQVPEMVNGVVPLAAGRTLHWKIAEVSA